MIQLEDVAKVGMLTVKKRTGKQAKAEGLPLYCVWRGHIRIEDFRRKASAIKYAKAQVERQRQIAELAALKAQVGLEDLLAAKEREWWVRIGKFRKALSAAGFHGHYNLFQEHFQDESGKWEAKEREIERLKAQVSATEWALTPDEGFGTLGKVNALIAARAAERGGE